MKSLRQQKQIGFHFVAVFPFSSDCLKVPQHTLRDLGCLADVVTCPAAPRRRRRRRSHNYDACLETSHTHTVKYIFSLFRSFLSHSLCPHLSVRAVCMSELLSLCLSLSQLHAESAEVSTERERESDAVPAYLCSPTHTGQRD